MPELSPKSSCLVALKYILLPVDTHRDQDGSVLAQWSDHLLAVRKFPDSNLVRTSHVHPAVKGYPISDSA